MYVPYIYGAGPTVDPLAGMHHESMLVSDPELSCTDMVITWALQGLLHQLCGQFMYFSGAWKYLDPLVS